MRDSRQARNPHDEKEVNMHIDLEAITTAENLERYCDANLEKRGNRSYNCPFCGSGTHRHGTPAFALDGKGHFKCFACENGGDLLDLIGHVEGLASFEDRARRAAEFCGVEVHTTVKTARFGAKTEVATLYTPKADHADGRRREAERVAGYVAAYQGSDGERYARGRGVDKYPLTYGYDAEHQRLVVKWPACDWYHVDRDVTDQHDRKYVKPRASEVGKQPIFSTGVADSTAFVVVEGPMDAGALMSLGFEHVVALCGTGYRDLLARLTTDNFKGGVVVMLDNDEPGRTQSKKFYDDLEKAGIVAYVFQWEDTDEKDADEVVRAGRGDDLKERVTAALATAADMAREDAGSMNVRLLDPFEVAEHLFFGDDADTPIPTGIDALDNAIGGGLTPGLYVIGATSSFGKTTVSTQVCDHVAAHGTPTLFVTVEQSAREIVAKSLSRLTHDTHNSTRGGITAQEIMNRRESWDAGRYEALMGAVNRYTAETAPMLRILECVAKPTVAEILQAARDMKSEFGVSPLVCVDYLQLLSPANDHMSDKQAVDFNITALRQLARDMKSPVWCVCALNRESYSGPVDLDSYKESGSIEFGCDYAFGLQPRGISEEVASVKSAVEKKLKGNAFVNRAKRDNPRKVELTVLKNRQGETTGTDKGIPLLYYPRTNLFIGG